MDIKLIIGIISISIVIGSIISTWVQNLFLKRLVSESVEKFKSDLQNKAYLKQRRWEIKRNACMKALDIADATMIFKI